MTKFYPGSLSRFKKKTGNAYINVTLRCVRVLPVAVGKQ